jgi:hypothetical protein
MQAHQDMQRISLAGKEEISDQLLALSHWPLAKSQVLTANSWF